jgi:hypothetical protein
MAGFLFLKRLTNPASHVLQIPRRCGLALSVERGGQHARLLNPNSRSGDRYANPASDLAPIVTPSTHIPRVIG